MANNELGPNLPELFGSVWGIYEYTDNTDDPTGSTEYQKKICLGISHCEKAVGMVNHLSLFSDNEAFEEVSTNEIRYLLLPALLGYFTSKQIEGERIENLNKAMVYYADFLRLCKNYEVTSIEIPKIEMNPDELKDGPAASRGPPSQEDMKRMANQRAAKIQRFRRKKDLEQNLKELYTQVQREHVDDEVKREYYKKLVDKWVDASVEEIESMQDEIPLLLHMSKMKSQGATAVAKPVPKEQEKQPFRPFILTKSDLQKQVFGLGYPGIPTYTLEQFYEAQVAAGMFPQAGSAPAPPVSERAEAEKAEVEKEQKIENDDPEALRKAREWDEYTDENRRGWGNMKNQG